jgi:preprotein translocase subunit SecG
MGKGGKGGASCLVMVLSFLFFLIAFGLAVGAETRRSQGKQVQSDASGLLVCQYTPSTATGLAAGALLFLLIAQLFIMIVTRCLCCGSAYNPGAARTFAVLAFIFSWLFFILAFAVLLAGASGNKIHTKGYISQSVTCHQVKKSLFAAGAALTFLTMLLSELYYVLIMKASSGASYGGPSPSVGMSTYA